MGNMCLQVLSDIIDDHAHLEKSYPGFKVKSSHFLARLIEEQAVSFGAVCKWFLNGVGHPMALHLFKHLQETKGTDWLTQELKSAKMTCTDVLPGSEVF